MTDEDRELEAIVRAAEASRAPGDVPIYKLPIRKHTAPAKPKPKRARRPQRAPFDVDKVHKHDGKAQNR